MAVGTKLAYVLRGKGGRNLLIRANGLRGEEANDAATDAVAVLSNFAASQGKPATDGSGDAPPEFALGRLIVSQGRYAVTYRMVNSVLVILVSLPTANPFTCLHAVDAAAKVLTAACKGIDVTAERVIKRYSDVYTMLGQLLDGGLDALPPAFVHVAATDERLVAMPSTAGDAARRIRRLVGPGARSSAFISSSDKSTTAEGDDAGPPPVPDTPTERDRYVELFAASADPLADVMFEIPMDALPPPPARALGARRRPPPPAAVAVAVEPPPAYKGAVADEDEDLALQDREGFGAFAEQPDLLVAEKAEEPAVASAADTNEEESDKGPRITVKDARESLMLVEFWKAEARGDRIIKAGVEGAVRRRLAPYGLEAVRFQITPSETPIVNKCMTVANMNKETAQKIVLDTTNNNSSYFVAALAGAPMTCSYLKYTLPAIACRPPLLAQLIVAPMAKAPKAGSPWQCLVAIQYTVNSDLSGPLLDVMVDLQLPPEITVLNKVNPAAQWSKDQGRVRWAIPRIEPGEQGVVRAVLSAADGVNGAQAEEGLVQVTAARMAFTGWPNSAVSGLGFHVAMPKADEFIEGRQLWFGDLVLRPA